MTTRYGLTFTGTYADGSSPAAMVDPGKNGAKERLIRETLDLTAMATAGTTPQSGDLVYLGRLPVGAYFSSVGLTTDTSLAAATVSVGSATSPAKYKPAAVFTTTDTPTSFAPTAAKAQAALTAYEEVYATIGAAALPSTGKLVFEIRYLATA